MKSRRKKSPWGKVVAGGICHPPMATRVAGGAFDKGGLLEFMHEEERAFLGPDPKEALAKKWAREEAILKTKAFLKRLVAVACAVVTVGQGVFLLQIVRPSTWAWTALPLILAGLLGLYFAVATED